VNSRIPEDFRHGSEANDFGDALARYALYYRWGVDAAATGFPDLAVTARRA
jgi:glycerophosphoryl diester phosphodiesterase